MLLSRHLLPLPPTAGIFLRNNGTTTTGLRLLHSGSMPTSRAPGLGRVTAKRASSWSELERNTRAEV
ncbi:hypothetical protein VZT92_018637 [Zoarces viviparus]|uniref:Uncharacterized protein n=1 Tax=Zoarces viviparus TaxID=48416 RepID=A0AAW1EIH7_ZOAVI